MNIKNRIGKTPLIRAKNLEEMLGISKIFLKLEGNNPSGNKIDRLAILLIKDALSLNKNTICLGGHNELAKSIASTSQFYNIKCVFVFKRNSRLIKNKSFAKENIKLIEYDAKIPEQCIEYSKKLSRENDWYNANPGFENAIVNMTAFSTITDEITRQVKEPISTVFAQTRFGYVISGLHLGFRRLWIEEAIKNIPVLYSCTSNYGNIIYKEYKKNNMEIIDKKLEQPNITKYNKNVIIGNSNMLKNALDAIYDTGGRVTGIKDEELEKYVCKLRDLEKINITIQNGYAISGFIKEVEAGNIKNGNHVIILNDGKINLEVEKVEKKDIEVEKVVELLHDWLGEYGDSKDEIKEGIMHASEDGYILFATQNDDIKGIALIVNTGFEKFIPSYHLGYIATKKGVKGMGIATQLLNKAIEITGGNISLHVDKNNKRAINVYEKMGFKQYYIRMIHK